ncbi:MAG: hypothetical protein KF893_20135 [Caldilineaceae bacterium]|nr:hypothetical protein [Caldilineaceae bacterium]
MNGWQLHIPTDKPIHSWLKPIHFASVPGATTPLLDEVMTNLIAHLDQQGHRIQDQPTAETDLILTTARFGEPVEWRKALLFSARRRLQIARTPTILTLVHITRAQFEEKLAYFADILQKEEVDPHDYDFPGLAPGARVVLHEQGRRGGAILALERLVQAQSKSIRVLLIVGDSYPEEAYHFDLVGAYPRSKAASPDGFYADIVLRIVTALSTREVTKHEVVGDLISQTLWQSAIAPEAMCNASVELGKRQFFTNMVQITDLVAVPAVSDAVSSQYSEGCFATWDTTLNALIATVTGSARPVNKGNLTERDLAIIVGLRSDGMGAQVRHVAERQNDPPSSEAVEMMDMDTALPTIRLDAAWGSEAGRRAPVVRSKLHGHRSISAYDPAFVEFVPLDAPYYHYLVSCATEAQAQGIKGAFGRSEALHNPDDPRQIVFTILPGHGLMLAEKWKAGTVPFQILWEAMDSGALQIQDTIPQGPMGYVPDADGMMVVQAEK